MSKNLPQVIRKVSNFLEKPLTDEQVSILEDHLSFENMKKNPAVNKQLSVWSKADNATEKVTSFIRNGRCGTYKEYMSEEMITRFDNWINVNIQGTDFLSRIKFN